MVLAAQWIVLLWNVGRLLWDMADAMGGIKLPDGQVVHSWSETLPVVVRAFFIMILSTAGCFNHIFH